MSLRHLVFRVLHHLGTAGMYLSPVCPHDLMASAMPQPEHGRDSAASRRSLAPPTDVERVLWLGLGVRLEPAREDPRA